MIDAYPSRPSVRAGEDVVLHVATDAPGFRVEWYRAGTLLEHVGTSPRLAGELASTASPAEDWQWPSYRLSVPDTWRSGVYIAVCVAAEARGRRTPEPDARTARALVIVRPAEPRARLLYKVPVCTYHAYNFAGGGSLYFNTGWAVHDGQDVCRVSLRRPGGGTGGAVFELPDAYDTSSPRQTFAHWDAPFIAWFERSGFDADFCADIDLELDPRSLDGYEAVVTAGHDEYWSPAMREATQRFVDKGGSLGIFGADSCWWRIALIEDATAIVCAKSRERLSSGSGLWWQSEAENRLTGVSYRNGGGWWDGPREAVGYRVQHPDHWVFADTGLASGDVLGADARLVGYECDGAHFDDDRGIAVATGADDTPPDFTILGVGPLSDAWEFAEREVEGPRAATLGLYERDGVVFNAATTDWVRVLVQDTRAERMTRNVLRRLERS